MTGRYHRLPKKITDDYIIEPQILGSGYSGQIRLARSRQGTGEFAVKTFKLTGVSAEKLEELETEAEVFLGMDHPHVARLVDVYECPDELSLVMECLTGGELFARVRELKRFSEADAARAVFQMLLAVNYIHSHGVVHRDIKLENFLYDQQGSDNLKLIDFGFSKIVKPNTKMALSCGTLSYAAPEVLTKSYTSQCDLWSLGVVVFILLFGYMPFPGQAKPTFQVKCILNGRFTYKKECWERISELGQDFVRKLLVVDPAKRMSANDALQHKWLLLHEQHSQAVSILDQGIVDALINFGKASAFRRICLSMTAWSLTNEERNKVRDAFLAFDVSRNGTILLWEFKQILKDNFDFPDAKVEELFKALDLNNTQEIQYSNFLAAMVQSRIQLSEEHLRQTFRRFDTDRSGVITIANLKEVLGETFDGEQVEKLMKEADFLDDNQICYEEWIQYLQYGEESEYSLRKIDVSVPPSPVSQCRLPDAQAGREGQMAKEAPQCCAVQ